MLDGIRFMPTIETAEGRRLNETMVKELTGGDTVTARRMRQDFSQFRPTHHLWLATNHKPTIKGTDMGIWSRIHLFPFTVTISDEEMDKTLKDKLEKEWPGILAWLVQGCLEWQTEGLQPPAIVVQATSEYRAQMDTVADFLDERCCQQSTASVKVGDLYIAYQEWATKNGDRSPLQKRIFGEQIQERGFSSDKGAKGVRKWNGLGLLVS